MPTNNNKQEIEINLTKTNAALAEEAAKILRTTVEAVITLCLAGSTNPAVSAA